MAPRPTTADEPAFRPPPGNPRFPMFDGLRAIAAMSVLVTHTSGYSTFGATNDPFGLYTARLNVGVSVFFVISGFLLYRPFVAARLEGTPRPSFGRFWWRRALRILPAYWAALIVLSAWPGLLDVSREGFGGFPGEHPWRFALLIQNLDPDTIARGIGPAWSLCVEAEFYLLLPFLALAADRLFGARRGREVAALLGLGAASLVARTLAFDGNPSETFFYTVPGMFLWFAPGMALAVVSAHWHAAGRREGWADWLGRHAWVAWAAALAVLTLSTEVGLPRDLLFRYSDRTWFGEHLLYGTIAALVVLPAVAGDGYRGPVQRLLTTRPMALLGLVSYGVFLYHLPIAPKFIGVLDDVPAFGFPVYTAVVAAVAIAYGTASYVVVERPALRLKDRGRRARPAEAAPEPG